MFGLGPLRRVLTCTFIDDYRLLCRVDSRLNLLDFAVESEPRRVEFQLRVLSTPMNIRRSCGPNDTGLFSANPESGIVVVTVQGSTGRIYALVIPTDFFVGFKSESNPAVVPWGDWKGFVMRVPMKGLFSYVFHAQLFLPQVRGADQRGGEGFKVYDFSPYTRMGVEKGNNGYGNYNWCNSEDEVTSYNRNRNLKKPLATTCSGGFKFRGNVNTTFHVTEGGVLFLTVRTPAVAKRTGLLT